MHRALWLLLFPSTVACSQLFEYPEVVVEQGSVLCADGLDNDGDGVVDCEDLDCNGSCSEQSLSECADERDNDGDGLADAADPRCWAVRPPHALRCAEASGVELIETFDVYPTIGYAYSQLAAWSWRGHLSGDWGEIAQQLQHRTPDRRDVMAGFIGNANQDANALPGPDALSRGLGALVRQVPFAGAWQDFYLAFSLSVPADALLRAAIVPQELAPGLDAPALGAEAALVSVTVDGTVSPVTFTLGMEGALFVAELPSVPACEEKECWARIQIVADHLGVHARLTQPDGSEVEVSAPLPSSPHLPPSRLVFWGGTIPEDDYPVFAVLDDVRLSVQPEQPCGVAAPQIPEQACSEDDLGTFGQSVSVARNAEGDSCALVLAGPAATGPSLPSAEALTTWSSTDGGKTWESAAVLDLARLDLPEDAVLEGGGIDSSDSGFHAVVTYRDDDRVRLGFLDAEECSGWGDLEPGPELPADAEAASYVSGPGEDAIYFTRPPGEVHRTLWRLERDGSDAPELVAELPLDVGAPLSVQRVGEVDLVLSFPKVDGTGAVSVGLLVQEGDEDWQAVELALPFPPASDLPGHGRLAFDDSGVVAVALSSGPDGGYLLYAGRSTTGRVQAERLDGPLLAVGTARFAAGDQALPDASIVPSDGAVETVEDSLVSAADWEVVPSDVLSQTNPYLTLDPPTLQVLGGDNVSFWSVLPLEDAVSGDFELSFDLFVSLVLPSDPSCALHVGLASPDDGVFARAWQGASCLDSFSLTPFVVLGDDDGNAGADDAECIGDRALPMGAWQHVQLRREGGVVTVAFETLDGCGVSEETVETALTEPLQELRIGFGRLGAGDPAACAARVGTASIKNITLEAP